MRPSREKLKNYQYGKSGAEMKYDSGMKQFHKDILAALQYMLKDDKEIAEKFSPKDGSPAPMRDYLKGKYHNKGQHSNGVGYWCTLSKGVEVYFNESLNNDGDKTLTLSWSQTAKFIRDNWDEIFKKSAPKTKISPLYTLVKTFDEDDITCPNWKRGRTLTYLETVNGVHFECKAFSSEFCKFDDITNFLVRHCNRPENCLYNKDTAQKQPSYIDKLREQYPKVNETDEWFDTVYCPSELFDGDGVNDPADDKCSYTTKDDEACQKCWRERCPANISFVDDLEDFEDEYFENYPKGGGGRTGCRENVPEAPESETAEGTTEAENQLIPQNAGEISEMFNYAVLSAELGDFLKRKEQQLKNEYMNFTANCGAIFAEVQEKLAKDGHGTFIKWIEAMGFKAPTVYRMIDVYKFRLSLIEKDGNGTQEIFDNLPKYLQYDISAKSAPAELVEQVLNGDITTHKDYIALKKQLEYTKAACDHANKRRDENYNQYQDEHRKNVELEKRVKELESRPIDVAVQQDETSLAEIDRLKNELAKAQQEILNASFGSSTADNSELLADLYETLHGSALSAIRSCADFAEKNGGKFTSRFRSLAEVINDYLNEMEEF